VKMDSPAPITQPEATLTAPAAEAVASASLDI
jgi:hypothetical protein